MAKVLYSMFLEIGDRPVTLLDGILCARTFPMSSISARSIGISMRRIGFVASEITKNRGIAICAPIAPYEHTRQEIRQIIEQTGGFIEVHMWLLPLRNAKSGTGRACMPRPGRADQGIYRRTYEDPVNPELRINTTDLTPAEAAQEILFILRKKGYI
ncbi:MAG: adenylyl-sulfate kinase [Desulfobacterales bacterium]